MNARYRYRADSSGRFVSAKARREAERAARLHGQEAPVFHWVRAPWTPELEAEIRAARKEDDVGPLWRPFDIKPVPFDAGARKRQTGKLSRETLSLRAYAASCRGDALAQAIVAEIDAVQAALAR